MGLSINYKGRFSKDASLSKMLDELKEIMEILKWDYFIYDEEFPKQSDDNESYNENIYGISFNPPECETVFLSFLSNRRMSSIVNLKHFGNSSDKKYQEYLYLLSVKTQFAGVEMHKTIIGLFRYLKEKDYFESLEIMDEGQYWETGDEQLLKDTFKKYTFLLDNFRLALETSPKNKDEDYVNYFERLAKMIQNRKGNDG